MTQDRTGAITDRLLRWLDRYQPRKDLRGPGKEQALQDETNALLRIVLKAAPSYGYEAWLEDALERVDLTMTTSAWPTAGQLASAIAAPPERREAEPRPEEREHPVARAIANGTARDERHARWLRYELTTEQTRRAMDQRPCREEWDHHVTVMARFSRFQGLTRAEVERICAFEISPGQLPEHLKHLGSDVTAPPSFGYEPLPIGRVADVPAMGGIVGAATKRFPEPAPIYQPTAEELRAARSTGRYGILDVPIPPPEDLNLVPDPEPDWSSDDGSDRAGEMRA